MADQRLDEADLQEILARVAAAQAPDPAFRERLAARLRSQAQQSLSRNAGEAIETSPAAAAAAPASRTAPGRVRIDRRLAAAALSFAAAAGLTFVLLPRRASLPPMAPIGTRLSIDAPVHLRAPVGRCVGVELSGVRLELRDGAEVAFRPEDLPTLELVSGFVRVALAAGSGTSTRVRAGDRELQIHPGADVALELLYVSQIEAEARVHADAERGKRMRNVWLVPGSALSGAGLTLAVLVAQGRVAFSTPPQPPSLPAGEVMVLRSDDGPHDTPHRLAQLEQKVTALRTENGRLAGQLARSKGVTVASVLERISGLKRTSLAGMLVPGAMAELVTDLKGLGDEGVQAMIKLLQSPDDKERFLAANLLEQLNSPASIPALRQAALTDKDKMPAVMASHALALMEDAATVPALREIVAADKSWESRVNALWGLAKHGDQKAIAESLAIMKDEKQPEQLRGALGGNLLLLTDPELLPIADETVRQFAQVEQVGMLAVEYYKTVGTAEARSRWRRWPATGAGRTGAQGSQRSPAGKMTDAVELTDVDKSFGAKRAVVGLSLRVPEGTVYGFIGPNGSGKTTTLRMIMRILHPDRGDIRVLGEDASVGDAANDGIGYLPEERGLYRKMKVGELLRFYAELKGVPRRAPRRCGAGWSGWAWPTAAARRSRRCPRAWPRRSSSSPPSLHRPELVILDEPFSGLDPVNMEVLKDAVLELRRDGATVIFSTHDMDVAERMCDFIFMIYRGRKVLDGTLDAIQEQLRHRHRAAARGGRPARTFAAAARAWSG